MSSSLHLTIGPVRFALWTAEDLPLRYSAWGYRGFAAEPSAAGGTPPLAEMAVEVRWGEAELPAGDPLYESGKNWAVWPDGDGWCFCSRYAGRERPGMVCRANGSLDSAVLTLAPDQVEDPLSYPLDQVLSWGLLTRCGGVVMHAALIERNGRGLVLAGRSGAGKSTLAALCRGQGWRGLNDDRAILYQPNDAPMAAGTPWHGTGLLAEPDEVPPAAILLLEQADEERLERMPPRTAKLELLCSTSIPWFEDRWAPDALQALDRLVESIPVYRFCFTKTADAAAALDDVEEVSQCV